MYLKAAYILCFFALISFDAFSQLTSLLDFEADDFAYAPREIIARKDSLYILTNGSGEDNLGSLFRIGHDGLGYTLIKSFDQEASFPRSMVGNDSVIYGTTRFSPNGNGKLFRYTYSSGKFEYLKEFSDAEGKDITIKYITDSVLWGYSDTSLEDEGSIFTIQTDGTSFKKIYNNTSSQTGKNPADILIANGAIYIAFFNGGGIPYENGSGGIMSSGCIAKVDLKGENYSKLITGKNQFGTQPQSLIHYNGRIYGLFVSAGTDNRAKLFSIKEDGSDFNSLATLDVVGRGKLKVVNDSIYGITAETFFGYGIASNSATVLAEFTPCLGRDAVSGPVFTNDTFIIGTQQGGAGGSGGSILKYSKGGGPAPDSQAGEPPLVGQTYVSSCINSPLELKATGTLLKWYDANSLLGTGETLHFTPDKTGIHTFYVTQTRNGCEESPPATITVEIIDYRQLKLFIPNVITPSGDGLNEEFYVRPSSVEACLGDFINVSIYNRYGTRVFTGTNRDFHWSPKKGTGVFYYQLSFQYASFRGHFTVLK